MYIDVRQLTKESAFEEAGEGADWKELKIVTTNFVRTSEQKITNGLLRKVSIPVN
jgi:hypothetical protein